MADITDIRDLCLHCLHWASHGTLGTMAPKPQKAGTLPCSACPTPSSCAQQPTTAPVEVTPGTHLRAAPSMPPLPCVAPGSQPPTDALQYSAGTPLPDSPPGALQCLYRIPELRTALQSYPEGGAASVTMAQQGAHKLTVAAKGLFGDLQRSAQPVHPFRFLLMLREAFPQFAQQGREGHYSQQDAEECWSQLVYTLRGQLKVGSPGRRLP